MGVVDDVKDRLDITEYLGRHIQLQKSGRYFKGLCPFHTEKTPSFFVFPDNQRWHCFGCGKGGDLFNFVMEFEGLDFRTALEELARRAGVELQPRTPEQVETETETERLRALHEAATDYYHQLLLTAPQAAHARQYLAKRGFTRETLETFRIGYSLEAWDATRTHLSGQGFTIEDQVAAGLLVQRDESAEGHLHGTFDRFRDRVMIPICDRKGRVIAFGGRVLSKDAQPKYMNSPQTLLFDKSKVLFGYHLASQAIRQADAAVIVEGYMDVMIPYQAGYCNVVAPMGTALTEAHLKQLQRLTKRFILALDPDAAGVHGTLQGLETARQTLEREWEPVFDPRGLVGYEGRLKADIRVVTMPEGLDPDELILENPARWEQLIAGSQPIVRFYFQQLLKQENPAEPKGKARIVDAMLPLLGDIADSVEREAYIQEVAMRLGLDSRVLQDRLRARDRAQAVRQHAAAGGADRVMQAADMQAHVLAILMRYPELLAQVDQQFQEADLQGITDEDFSSTYRLVWSAWSEMSEHPEVELDDLLPVDIVAQVYQWITMALPDMAQEQLQRDVSRTVLRLREKRLRATLQQTQALVAEAQIEGDLKATRYSRTIQALFEELLRVQWALAQ